MFFVISFLLFSVNLRASEAEINQLKFVKFNYGVSKSVEAVTIKRSGYKIKKYYPEISWYSIEPELTIKTNIDYLKTNSLVSDLENNEVIYLTEIPNDPRYKKQKKVFESINAPEAWDITTGSRDIIVAVSDTGVGLKHKEIKDNIWVNINEIPNNNIDDDNNGYVDDVNGWNWVRNNNNPMDDQGHGSHVAGTIGAIGNNKVGIAGMNWKVSIMPLKFISKKGTGSTEGAIDSVLYATNNGAHIFNASWGSPSLKKIFRDAVKYATDNNVLIVAAAGNAKRNLSKGSFYPAKYDFPGVIAVGAVNASGKVKEIYSNYGIGYVDVAAQGTWILSLSQKKYRYLTGTSMAAPFVAGLGALILSKYPNLKNYDLENAIINSVTKVKNLNRYFSSGGVINAHKALTQFEEGPQIWPSSMQLNIGLESTLS